MPEGGGHRRPAHWTDLMGRADDRLWINERPRAGTLIVWPGGRAPRCAPTRPIGRRAPGPGLAGFWLALASKLEDNWRLSWRVGHARLAPNLHAVYLIVAAQPRLAPPSGAAAGHWALASSTAK